MIVVVYLAISIQYRCDMKTCNKCSQQKPLGCFGNKASSKDGLQAYCKVCNKEYQRSHYNSNKKSYIDKSKVTRDSNREWLFNFKLDKPCKDCGGVFHPCAMDFDHIEDNKHFDVSDMMEKARSKIIAEINKCELVCSNCHRVRTFMRRNTLVV